MLHNQAAFLLASERLNDLQRKTQLQKVMRTYPDKERQPKRLFHWANR